MNTVLPSPPAPLRFASTLSRRDALSRLSAGALLALGLWPGCLSARARSGEPGSFKFIAVNDTHYLSPDCGQYLEGVVRQMKTAGAEFCLHLGDLTEKGERAHLAVSGKLITFEIGIRFLTDFLEGDTYFKVHREGHNLDRCRTQFKLVESIEQHEPQMNKLVERI